MADPLSLDLQPASFRGVRFQVEASSFEAGRRVQVHEYPQRDKPWAEDLGRATRSISVDAFVVGADYIDQANALIDAAEQEGSGTLVHPWFGSMEVSLKDPCRVRFSMALGYAVVSFSFVESGDLEFPSASDSTQTQSQISADTLCTAASESFSNDFSLGDFPSFVSAAAGLNLSSAFAYAGTLGGSFSALSGWASQLGGYATSALQLLHNPLGLAQQVMDWFDLSPIVAALSGRSATDGPTYATAAAAVPTSDPLTAIALGIVGLAGNGGAGGILNAPVPVLKTTPARQQLVTNTAAINALTRRALLAQAVGISSVIDTTVQTDAHAVRDALCDALDAESLLADDVSYDALQVARRTVWTDITTRASNGARLLAFTPGQVTPALVLAYDRYEDAERAIEIADRNHVTHPGFVPVRSLQVLSR